MIPRKLTNIVHDTVNSETTETKNPNRIKL